MGPSQGKVFCPLSAAKPLWSVTPSPLELLSFQTGPRSQHKMSGTPKEAAVSTTPGLSLFPKQMPEQMPSFWQVSRRPKGCFFIRGLLPFSGSAESGQNFNTPVGVRNVCFRSGTFASFGLTLLLHILYNDCLGPLFLHFSYRPWEKDLLQQDFNLIPNNFN